MIGNGNFVAKAKKFKQQIDFINNVSTGLIHPETTVEIKNQTPVYIEYNVASPEYTGRIVFNGDIVSFLNANIVFDKNESSRYIGLKLDILHRELDKKIKTNAKMAARVARHNARVARLREILANRVLGRGGL